MYYLTNRIIKDKKLVGYSVMDATGSVSKLKLDEIRKLAANHMIGNAIVDKQGRIRGNNVDLRTLPAINLNNENRLMYGLFEVKNITVSTTDYDSDLWDAQYKTKDNRVYIVGCDIQIDCMNSKSLQELYVALNKSGKNSIVQTYGDSETGKGHRLSLKVLTYKPIEIIELIAELKKFTKATLQIQRDIAVKRHRDKVCNFKVDLKAQKIYSTEGMNREEYELIVGLMGYYKKHIK